MSQRDDTLRRIFDATGVSRRLTDDQQRELLAHLDDAVQAKVDSGVPEMDAVGRAFVELGPLKKIVDQFPPNAAAVAPEGGLLATWSRTAPFKGLALVAVVAFIQTFITPKLVFIFQETGIVAPTMTRLFLSGYGQDLLVGTASALTALAALQVVARRKHWTRKAVTRLQVSAVALYGAVAVCSVLFAVGCGLGVSRLFGDLLG